MRVLDATFLVDYGNELDATAEYLLNNTDEETKKVIDVDEYRE